MFAKVFRGSAFSNLRNRLRRGGHDVAHEGEHAHDHHHHHEVLHLIFFPNF